MKESVTLTVNQEKLNEMREFYCAHLIPNEGEYVYFQAHYNKIMITGYLSKKENKKVTFIGDNALNEAKIWDNNASINEVKESIPLTWECIEDQIGSDEVGVGDFLLPMVVVSAFVRKKDIKILKEYGVKDSKKLTDEDIKEIAPLLVKKFFVSRLTIDNDKYNEMIAKGENLNSLKAKMHNRALMNLFKKFPDTKYVFVDQFVNENKYFEYLNDKNEIILKDIVFKTKGESYYPSVALASVIARYAFLLEKEQLENKYKMRFPFGANGKVNEFSEKFIKKYGIEEFNKIAKKNFANYREVVSNKLI